MDLESEILRYVSVSAHKITFNALSRFFRRRFQVSTKDVRKSVFTLVQTGKLRYTSQFGSAVVDVSLDHAVRVSEHVVVKPRTCTYLSEPGEIVLSLEQGASFGFGDHPSTRLAVQLMDWFFVGQDQPVDGHRLKVLDVGTGSGILGILAAKLGVGAVQGVDTDPCAIFEARQHVLQNDVAPTVTIQKGDLRVAIGPFQVVLANLRTPTLVAMRRPLRKKAAADGALIFSGLKGNEIETIRLAYETSGFFLLKTLREKGWAACCFLRGDLARQPS